MAFVKARFDDGGRSKEEYSDQITAQTSLEAEAAALQGEGYNLRRLQMVFDGPRGATVVIEMEPD